MHKPIFIVVGILSVILGVIGIFLPILPTTPFLLLAAALFAKSSDKLYYKLLNHKYLGPYIQDFRINRSITLKTKIISLSMMWATMSYTMIFATDKLWLRILLFAIAVGVTIHILSFKTKK